jgi:hypothetical protein
MYKLFVNFKLILYIIRLIALIRKFYIQILRFELKKIRRIELLKIV